MRTPKKQHIANGIVTMISYSNSIGSVVGTGVGKSVRSVVMMIVKVIHSVVEVSFMSIDGSGQVFDCIRRNCNLLQDILDLQYEWIESNGLDFKP